MNKIIIPEKLAEAAAHGVDLGHYKIAEPVPAQWRGFTFYSYVGKNRHETRALNAKARRAR